MKSTREYLDELRLAWSKPRMTDAEMGAFFGITQQAISSAKSKGMGVELAIEVGQVLARMGRIAHPAEVVLAAQVEREHKRGTRLGAVLFDYWKRHQLPGELPPPPMPAVAPRRSTRGRRRTPARSLGL